MTHLGVTLLVAEGGRLQAGPVSVPPVHRQVEGGPHTQSPSLQSMCLDPHGPRPETDVLLPLFDLPGSPDSATPGNWKPTASRERPSQPRADFWRTACSSRVHPLSRYCLLLVSAVLCPWGAGREPRNFSGAARPGAAPKASVPAAVPAIPGCREPRFPTEAPTPPGSLGPGRALLRLTSTPSHRVLSPCRADWLLSFVYRTSSVRLRVAGLQPVLLQDRRVENVDLSSVVSTPVTPGADFGGWGGRISYSSPATHVPGTPAPARSTPDERDCQNSLGKR